MAFRELLRQYLGRRAPDETAETQELLQKALFFSNHDVSALTKDLLAFEKENKDTAQISGDDVRTEALLMIQEFQSAMQTDGLSLFVRIRRPHQALAKLLAPRS